MLYLLPRPQTYWFLTSFWLIVVNVLPNLSKQILRNIWNGEKILTCVWMNCISSWYSWNGWLGIKNWWPTHPPTYPTHKVEVCVCVSAAWWERPALPATGAAVRAMSQARTEAEQTTGGSMGLNSSCRQASVRHRYRFVVVSFIVLCMYMEVAALSG